MFAQNSNLISVSIRGPGVHVSEDGVLVSDAQDSFAHQQGLEVKKAFLNSELRKANQHSKYFFQTQ
jgi:hypothetical protein